MWRHKSCGFRYGLCFVRELFMTNHIDIMYILVRVTDYML